MVNVANEDTRKAGGDASGASAIAIMMMVIAETQGEVVDQLNKEYSADLPEFTAFVESPPELDELRTLYDASHAAIVASTNAAVRLNQALGAGIDKWRLFA
ncbi:hypothetical protein PSP6_210177 [Paraburkholderia tropica]|uniref:hypothetical protein n=1 Tax=Paraburkholderia tropica TaxID=92647 RepID=UPI001CAB3CE6|nr:hypothetical protein [Paraburkholderia tropica]CAG9202325.1 hypothetical protein PSP6_210177 [Paraburkholderia tropica]